ncbi:MAG TPA: Hsp20/alpha crystallin family protein [Stellaceae bacterium]
MPTRDSRLWMWAEACEFLDRAERLHRQFFQPGRSPVRPNWEPPVDVVETARDLVITAALPGVEPDQVEVALDGDVLIIAGGRRLPVETRDAVIHRLEIPHGRFERQVPLPPGRYEVGPWALTHGCLRINLRKLRQP